MDKKRVNSGDQLEAFISMLRGINVSGQKKILMADLKNLYEALGLLDVETYVQSGNVVFKSAGLDAPELTRLIEERIEQTYGYPVSVFVRTPGDFQRLIGDNPFLNARNEDPAFLHVTFLYRPPTLEEWSRLENLTGDMDELHLAEREIYLFCPNGYGRTKLSNTFFERKLKMPATTRNWKTIMALNQLGIER